ncbi:MAG: DNA polymerase I [Eubacterium sp.]|jgi:DNA polymerase-1|nr:DNA polymerase I [Eubacterium sp.]
MKLLLIDGNSIANRSFYGIRPLSNKNGIFTQAITGFFNTYFRLIKKYEPDAVAVAFDLRAPTFRKALYDGYKANRKGMPDDLAVQMPYIKDILSALGISILEREGYEADDIIGTLAHISDLARHPCVIATGDRDALQLVSDNVTLHLVKTKEDIIYTPIEIWSEFCLSPLQMLDVKALQGDSSDNIPGVDGIGEKGALSLIQKYGSVDYIYEHIETLSLTPQNYKKLSAGKEMAFLSRKLGEICKKAPVPTALADYRPKGQDSVRLLEILMELEMFSLIKKLKLSLETEKIETMQIKADQIQHEMPTGTDIFFQSNRLVILENNTISTIEENNIKDFLENESKKRFFDIKSLWPFAIKNGIEIKNAVFDTTLAAYLLNVNASEYGLDRLCGEYGVEYNAENPVLSVRCLNDVLHQRILNEKMSDILIKIEIPLSEVLASMEHHGISLDIDGVKRFGKELETDISEIEQKIYSLSGQSFNIASPKQLGMILFEVLGLPSGRKTKTGYSTNADVLEGLMDKHPIVRLISEYRALSKLNSTYVAGLLKVVSPDSRIHTTFKQTETRTGRISSAEPNIQNIPLRTKRGREMRKFFIAPNGKKLVDSDYSQIELRILAYMSGDKIMQNAFSEGEDIHTITAAQVFNQPVEWVTLEMRTAAKAVNFGILYGIGAFSLAKDIGVSVAEADNYIKSYLTKYHGVGEFMKKVIAEGKRNGYVETLFGRRRYIPELNSSNKNIEAVGKRMAMNTPIQGTAADIIKIAMIGVYKRLKKELPKAKLILQVHDELIIECENADVEKASRILREEMEKSSVSLTVDIKAADTWYEAH